jgi:hypothetical protein
MFLDSVTSNEVIRNNLRFKVHLFLVVLLLFSFRSKEDEEDSFHMEYK